MCNAINQRGFLCSVKTPIGEEFCRHHKPPIVIKKTAPVNRIKAKVRDLKNELDNLSIESANLEFEYNQLKLSYDLLQRELSEKNVKLSILQADADKYNIIHKFEKIKVLISKKIGSIEHEDIILYLTNKNNNDELKVIFNTAKNKNFKKIYEKLRLKRNGIAHNVNF
jgi:hypothetical protein